MKDLLPPVAMQGTAVSDMTAGSVKKVVPKASQADLIGSSTAELSDDSDSFHEALAGSLEAISMDNGTSANIATSGKSLPLTMPSADASELTSAPVTTAEPSQQDLALTAGLAIGSNMNSIPDIALNASETDVSDTQQLIVKTVPQLAMKPGGDGMPNNPLAMKPGDGMPNPVVTPTSNEPVLKTLSEHALNKVDGLYSPDTALARMQTGSLDSTQNPQAMNRALTTKADLAPQLNTAEAVTTHPGSKSDVLLNETDQLFTSRMQLTAVIQPADLAGQKPTMESMLSTTQSASVETLQASLARTPLTQTALSSDLLTAPSQATITEAFGKPEWGQGMGKQVLWMVNQNISRAELRLNPANLGPLEVRIDMDNDQVNIAINCRHAEVRDAVEQALPRLREMLEEKGLNLSDTDVSQQSFAEQREKAFGNTDQNNSGLASSLSFSADDEQAIDQNLQATVRNDMNEMLDQGLVDYYI